MVIAFGRVATILLSLATVKIFTSLLDVKEVGKIYYLNSLMLFFGLIFMNPVGMYINRKLHNWHKEGNIANNFAVYGLYSLGVAVLASALLYIVDVFLHISGTVGYEYIIWLLVASIMFSNIQAMIVNSLNILEASIAFVLFNVLSLATGLLFSVMLSMIIEPSAIMWLYGQVISQALFAVLVYFFTRMRFSEQLNVAVMTSCITRENMVRVATYVMPLVVTTFLLWMQNQSYRILVERMTGLEFLACLGLGFSISSNVASAVESIVHQVYMPEFYREITDCTKDERAAACNRMLNITIPVYFSLTLFVSCLAPFLVSVLTHSRFQDTFWYVICGAWLELFRMISGVLSTAAYSEMQTSYLIKAYFVGAVWALAGIYLAATWSYFQITIPVVLVSSGLATMIVMYWEMRKLICVNIAMGALFKILAASLPFGAALLFFNARQQLSWSVVILLAFGAYFLGLQYLILKSSATTHRA
jgi:O-antigen/teichoic acid export membrane protein